VKGTYAEGGVGSVEGRQDRVEGGVERGTASVVFNWNVCLMC